MPTRAKTKIESESGSDSESHKNSNSSECVFFHIPYAVPIIAHLSVLGMRILRRVLVVKVEVEVVAVAVVVVLLVEQTQKLVVARPLPG